MVRLETRHAVFYPGGADLDRNGRRDVPRRLDGRESAPPGFYSHISLLEASTNLRRREAAGSSVVKLDLP